MQRGFVGTVVALVLVACGPAASRGPAPASMDPSRPPSFTESIRARVGGPARLTIIPRLQLAAEMALRGAGQAGAVVVLSPGTGAISAVFSVSGDRGDPLLVAHQPASTFKPFTALAALEAGAVTASTEKNCDGTYSFAGKTFTCSGAHGRETTSQALVRSCNVFFYDVGAKMDHGKILDVARRFGFGSRTGIELPDEPGVVPGQARGDEVERDEGSPVPLLDAIGHGEIEVTLLQLARAYAAVANGGKVLRLTLKDDQAPAVERLVGFAPEHLELVRGALVDTVRAEDGTAHVVAIPGLDFAAKTGTANAPPRSAAPSSAKEEEDSWFVAFAPVPSPTVLVAVRVERGDTTRNAKSVGKQVLEAWKALR